MYKYAVSVFFNDLREITIGIVYAQDAIEAALTYLASEYEDEVPSYIFRDYDTYINIGQLQNILENLGLYVAVERVTDSRAGRSGTGLQTQSAQLNSGAGLQ